MRKLVSTIVISAALCVAAASTAWANCYFETYFVDGKITSCTICITGNMRTVTCI